MIFKVGDLVKVSRIDNTNRDLYVSGLDDFVGEVGIVVEYDKSDNSYRVKLDLDKYYWFYEEWLELVYTNQTNNPNNKSNDNLNNLILLL